MIKNQTAQCLDWTAQCAQSLKYDSEMMKRTVCVIFFATVCAVALKAQDVVVPDGYEIVDSLIYRPVAAADTTLVGKSVWSVLPSESKGDAANVRVSQSERMKEALDAQVASNHSRAITGFRIRIFFDNGQNSRNESEAVLRRFESVYHGIPAYRTYANPYFKVTVGDFRTRSEAMSLLVRLRNEFPRALMVKEKINWPAADASCTYIVDTVRVLRPVATQTVSPEN